MSNVSKILDEGYSQYATLKCACCGSDNTHVKSLVWFRRSEDAHHCHTIAASLSGETKQLKTTNKLNPSARRDGIRIIYDCENCGEYSSLNIAQHKGATLVTNEKCPDEFLSQNVSLDKMEWML